ncbi:MAG: 23S rRNA (uracil(1939)-C(5))-methyltransferase RlmD [Candidatus Berkelbacteria bacterium]
MQVEIEKMGFAGSGIGHLDDGRVVFVKKVAPGHIVKIELTDQKKDFAFGAVKKIIKPSEMRIDPPCKYFYQCGGCEHQNISYKNQLIIKENLVKESLSRQKIDAQILPIIAGSEKELYYRNSIRFMFMLDKNNQIAFARHGYLNDKELVVVDECLLQSEKSNLILEKLRCYINENIDHKTSFWQLKIREGKRTNDVMVEIITASDDLPGEKGIVDVLKSVDSVKSIYHTIAPAKSLLRLRRRLIFGSPVIYEKIGSYTFQISPESFFQTNSEGVKTLYDKIKEFADIEIGDEVVDLYCGTGSIGIYLSTLAKKVTGIEVVSEAIRDAKDNAKINKITNCEFIQSDSSNITIEQLNNKIIILDPPRAGLPKDLILQLATCNFKNLVYVSCNPPTFARDLKYFQIVGISAKKIQPVDMFPQTHHTELVAELSKS